jgi:hypothetical protein
VRRLRADSHGSSRATRGERRRPLRRKQRTRSGGTANCSWRIWRWPGASRPRPSWRQRGRVWRGKLGRSSCATARRSGQEQRGAGPTRGAGLTAGSARFRGRVRVRGSKTTRKQAGGRWCGSRAGAVLRRCDQARRSCRKLRGCADRVSAAHAREQRRLSL